MNNHILSRSILMHSLLFGFGFPFIIKLSGSDILFSLIIGTIINLFIIFIYQKIKTPKIINIIISIIVIIIYLYIISTYISTFYLINIPKIIVVITTLLLAIYITSKEEDIINRSTFIMAFINLGLFIVMVIALVYKIEYENFLPILTHNKWDLLKGGLIYSLVTTIPYLHLNDKISLKENCQVLLIATFTSLIFFTLTLGILGPNFIKIYQYPEYMILKEIKMFSFIANVENIFAFIFGNEIIISIILYLNNLKKLLITK